MLFHATLQQTDYTSSTFPVTLLPWVHIKVIKTGIKLSLVVFSDIPRSIKQIGSQV